MRSVVALALFWAVGGICAIPLDTLHVVTGVLSYRAPSPWLPGHMQALWVVPLFAFAGLALGFGHRLGAVPLARQGLRPTSGAAAFAGLGALGFAYASSGWLQPWPVVALLVYTAVWVVIVARTDESLRRALVLHSVGTAIIGPLVEIGISSTGAFTYAHPDVLGVALWLPGIYLNAGAASHLLDRWWFGRAATSARPL